MGTYFFSYAGVDRPLAAQVVSGLQGAGIDVWWDQDGIRWSGNWITEIEEALNTCNAYILLLGKQGVKRWVKPELQRALCRHYEEDIPLFILLHPELDRKDITPFLSFPQYRTLPIELNDPNFFAVLVRDLTQLIDDPSLHTVEIPADFCPFPGLESFTEDRADFFFGRQRETAELLSAFAASPGEKLRRWIQIEGNSGVGKSSFVQSGLIPAIRDGWLDESGERYDWHVLVMRPGIDPCESLVAELCSSDFAQSAPPRFDTQIENIRDKAKQNVSDLALALKVALPKVGKAKVLLIVDQLEEVITLTTKAERRQRFDGLLAAAIKDPDCPLYLVTTIRSDFMLHFAELPGLQALLSGPMSYFLKPIDKIGLRDAVVTPVRRAKGWVWQPGTIWHQASEQNLMLPEHIIAEALSERDAALPLAANVMQKLWLKARERNQRQLSIDDYNALKGVGGALASTLDHALTGLSPDDKSRAQTVLLALVQSNPNAQDTRRTISKTQALQAAGAEKSEKDRNAAERILDWLSGIRVAGAQPPIRMIVISGGKTEESTTADGKASNDDKTVDLIHEILLRKSSATDKPYCETLYQWIKENRKQLDDRNLRQHLANRWLDMLKKSRFSAWFNGLANKQQLHDFRKAGSCSSIEQSYLDASSRRLTVVNTAMTGLLMTITSLGFAAYGTPISAQFANLTSWLVDLPIAWLRAEANWIPEPSMIAIPAGKLTLENNRQVDIKDFRIGQYEVTFAEYDVFVFANKEKQSSSLNADQEANKQNVCSELPPGDKGWGRGSRPVIFVSWNCAQLYLDWLNDKLKPDKPYRLPSETQWEYAIRAGTTSDYYWGDKGKAEEFAWFYENLNSKTHPVGEKKPNAFGLYDMAGNVEEWVEDCWHINYVQAPDNGSAWQAENNSDCIQRVLRGGSWFYTQEYLRSATRYRYDPDYRDSYIGFRLAQD